LSDGRRQRLRAVTGLGLLAAACGLGAAEPARGLFKTPVPRDWRTAERLMLVLNDVAVPKNRPVVLQVHATDKERDEALLGSYGIPGESETSSGQWTFEALRINVTGPLRRWLQAGPSSETVALRVTLMDGTGRTLDEPHWTVRSVELQATGGGRVAPPR
jgi:hypothetical protein